MRVIVMRIQIFSNVFHRIANFGKFFFIRCKVFFFSQKIKKSRADIDKKKLKISTIFNALEVPCNCTSVLIEI